MQGLDFSAMASASSAVPPFPEVFIGCQPILDRRQQLLAYELLFRSSETNCALVQDNLQATAQVIVTAFSEVGIGSALGHSRCFINVDECLLLSDLVELLPADRVTLELLESVPPSQVVVDRCRELRQRGFRFALDDFIYHPSHKPLIDVVDLIKLDLGQLKNAKLAQAVDQLKCRPLILLAEKVESHRAFAQCLALGFGLFQGYYFARPHLLVSKRIDPAMASILTALKLLAHEAETDCLEQTLKRDPILCASLLRLVNSVGVGRHAHPTSIRQAITVLGRRQLQRWLQLLLYAKPGSEFVASPLLSLAATRGKWMELLFSILSDGEDTFTDLAFMTGIFSLLDALFDVAMEDVVFSLDLTGELKAALLVRDGVLGAVLSLVERWEYGDFEQAAELAVPLQLTGVQMAQTQAEALRWSSNEVGHVVDATDSAADFSD